MHIIIGIYIYIHCHIYIYYIYMSIHVYNTCVLCIYTYLHMWAYQQWLQQRFRACARTEKATSRCHCAQATCFIISSMSWRDTLCDATAGILSCSSNCFVGIPSTKCYLHSIWPPDLATLATWISSRNQRGYSACFFLEHAKPSCKSPSSSPSLRASFSSLPRLVMERTWGNYTVDRCAKRILLIWTIVWRFPTSKLSAGWQHLCPASRCIHHCFGQNASHFQGVRDES